MERTRTNHDDEGVYVKPSVVVEATYQEIQETDEYTSGYALRVPKIVRFRPDKKTFKKLTTSRNSISCMKCGTSATCLRAYELGMKRTRLKNVQELSNVLQG